MVYPGNSLVSNFIAVCCLIDFNIFFCFSQGLFLHSSSIFFQNREILIILRLKGHWEQGFKIKLASKLLPVLLVCIKLTFSGDCVCPSVELKRQVRKSRSGIRTANFCLAIFLTFFRMWIKALKKLATFNLYYVYSIHSEKSFNIHALLSSKYKLGQTPGQEWHGALWLPAVKAYVEIICAGALFPYT